MVNKIINAGTYFIGDPYMLVSDLEEKEIEVIDEFETMNGCYVDSHDLSGINIENNSIALLQLNSVKLIEKAEELASLDQGILFVFEDKHEYQSVAGIISIADSQTQTCSYIDTNSPIYDVDSDDFVWEDEEEF